MQISTKIENKKKQKAQDVLVGAPSKVYPEQLEELHIKIVDVEE